MGAERQGGLSRQFAAWDGPRQSGIGAKALADGPWLQAWRLEPISSWPPDTKGCLRLLAEEREMLPSARDQRSLWQSPLARKSQLAVLVDCAAILPAVPARKSNPAAGS